ncbi:SDR family NAD(P)-dependent oxidoreductase [Halioxenophilus aromaticivorans]|uniref:SDR family oxidoreductase n=1 Tax=Halioxenophilus aromaticivorans TaxID=1306992 RepID=A0AAV3TXL8_9ALTE
MSKSDLFSRYGPWALVTGASSGIGEAFAKTLAGQGFNLILVARRQQMLSLLASQLQSQFAVDVEVVVADLGQAAGIEVLLNACGNKDLGLVICNAGFSMKGEYTSHSAQDLTAMVDLNCHAPLAISHALIDQLAQRNQAGLVFTSSVEALIGCPFSAVYSASKAFVRNLGEALWAEYKPRGVDVLTLCPGATDTEGLAKSGVDKATLANLMPAMEVAEATLGQLGQGPVYIASPHYQQLFEKLTTMPRAEALMAMANTMKPA